MDSPLEGTGFEPLVPRGGASPLLILGRYLDNPDPGNFDAGPIG